eukprot:TRINITY_DN7653_c0_g1_i1.p1 TRINITY_DN7653_c0_g1~~TRINITY_DN7653_c0_g1_i1.p1  ORF type:complete len:819 (-),score=184.87 TRINITY_DN7653_c0_g1_i1:54-2297(-)
MVLDLNQYVECSILKDQQQMYTFWLQPKLGQKSNKSTKEYSMRSNTGADLDSWVQAISSVLLRINDAKSRYAAGTRRIEHMIHVKVSEVRNLPGPMDTYITISSDGTQLGRTPTKWNDPKPLYGEAYTFDIPKQANSISIFLKDHNKKKNSVIGSREFELSEFFDEVPHEAWFQLTPGEQDIIPVTGKLKVICSICGSNNNYMTLHIVNATGLSANESGTSSPYVVARFGDQEYRTSYIKRQLNPQWRNETIDFPIDTAKPPPRHVHFEIFDHDRPSDSNFMGEVFIPFGEIKVASTLEREWELQQKRSNISMNDEGYDCRLTFHWQKAVILQDSAYDNLFSILMDSDMEATKLLASVSFKKEKVLAECLIGAFEVKKSSVHYLKQIISFEIANTPEAPVIFRGNTVATKSVDTYMRLTGLKYIQFVMKDIIQDICLTHADNPKKSCELDEYRLPMDMKEKDKERQLRKNFRTLINCVESIFFRIVDTLERNCPVHFRNIFEHIQGEVRKKFPEESDIICYTGPSGFIFLRFFCAALLTPKNFGLLQEHPPADVARDLTLIAKTLQNLANLVGFGKKEPFMEVCNSFIDENLDNMKNFIDALCKPPTEAVDSKPSRPKLNFGREMSRIHYLLKTQFDDIVEKYADEKGETIEKIGHALAEIDDALMSITGVDLDDPSISTNLTQSFDSISGSVATEQSDNTPDEPNIPEPIPEEVPAVEDLLLLVDDPNDTVGNVEITEDGGFILNL